jgi:hypothetical protein
MKKGWYLWGLLLLQTILLVVYLNSTMQPFTSRWDILQSRQFIGDETDYITFPFTSIHAVLDNYRSFGFPWVIRFYNLFFHGYQYWPHFQFVLYILSVYFLFWVLKKSGFDAMLSFLIATFLLWNIYLQDNIPYFQFYRSLPYLNTEVICVCLMNLTIGLLFLAIRYTNWKTNIAFALSLFFLYQVRPNVSYFAVLAPLWALTITTKKKKQTVIRISLLSIVPLIIFALLRMVVVGQFGFSTMTGGTLVGHATQYLNEENVKTLDGESRVIGEEILQRKRQLTPPCNTSPFTKPPQKDKSLAETESICFGYNLMTAWDVAIKQESGKEPFTDAANNIEPWKHMVSLAPFYFPNYHMSTDQKLMKFSKDILRLEWKQYLNWLVIGAIYGLQMLLFSQGMILWYWVFIVAAIISQRIFRKNIQWRNQTAIFAFIAFSNFAAGYFLLLLFNFPFDRMYLTLTPYLVPAFVLLAVPPLWLQKNS